MKIIGSQGNGGFIATATRHETDGNEAILRIAASAKSILCRSNRTLMLSLVRNRVCAHRIVAIASVKGGAA